MTQILTSVLSRFSGLELIQFKYNKATPMRAGAINAESGLDGDGETAQLVNDDVSGQVFVHGIVLEFQGSFLDTLKYLRFLEDVSGSFFWDSISFNREEWPTARITLEIHTLSTEEGFIGV